jgi:hypothetical protein
MRRIGTSEDIAGGVEFFRRARRLAGSFEALGERYAAEAPCL